MAEPIRSSDVESEEALAQAAFAAVAEFAERAQRLGISSEEPCAILALARSEVLNVYGVLGQLGRPMTIQERLLRETLGRTLEGLPDA